MANYASYKNFPFSKWLIPQCIKPLIFVFILLHVGVECKQQMKFFKLFKAILEIQISHLD